MDDVAIDRDRLIEGDALPDEYFCPICRCLLWNPRSCESCQHVFCQKCIETWLKHTNGNRQCPFRCQDFRERNCPPMFLSLLSRVKIQCRNASFGCTEVLTYDSLERHERAECKYLTRTCQECMQLILVSELNEHLRVPGKCVPCPIRCVICQSLLEKDKFMNHFSDCYQNRIANILKDHVASPAATAQQDTMQLTEQQRAMNLLLALTNAHNAIIEQRQRSGFPSTLNGLDMVQRARDRNCGHIYHICLMMIFVLMNWRKAPQIIWLFSFTGFTAMSMFMLGLYILLLNSAAKHIHIGSFIIMLFSSILSISVPYLLQHVTDKWIVFSVGSILFCVGCSLRIQLELLELENTTTRQLSFILRCLIGMLVMKILLLFVRFFFWCSPIYLTAAIFAFVNIYLAFRLPRFANMTPLPPYTV